MTFNRLRSLLSETLTSRRGIASGLPSWHLQQSPLAGRIVSSLLVAISLTGLALAQSQSQTPSPPQPESQQRQSLPVADSPKTKADKDNSATSKVYTNHVLKELPSGDISVVGPATSLPGAASGKGESPAPSASANKAYQDAKAAAYWKARFTAARNKLAQDQKALPVLQSQLEAERGQQTFGDDDSTQVYSDEFMDLLRRIDATKIAVQSDKKALNDLHVQFPAGWRAARLDSLVMRTRSCSVLPKNTPKTNSLSPIC
jgi:hypothetical protein